MSTSYYRLREPITHLNVKDLGGHDKIKVWVDHGLAGELIVPKGQTRGVIDCFVDYDKCPLRTHWGGQDCGAIVTVNDPSYPNEAIVVSEYGEVLTVAEVKARDGAKRADGMPTELFGYEDK